MNGGHMSSEMPGLEELHMADAFSQMHKATPRAIVESLPIRTITQE